ncbi:septum formation initiator family protein [Tepidibacillus infernus]|uniref:FtsB family cell division protein n=1 Tax=Tepidibacillus TaxID=1494427 RepID=UPI00085372B5|nr:septum formation initiator family protein [Tepidibacillus sp. HK-1]GBF11391.1 cell division protein FtsB [Tepidibacillus sp. HK-1]
MSKKNQINHASRKRIHAIILLLMTFIVWAGFTGYNQWIDIKEKKAKLVELQKQEQQVAETKRELEKKVMLLQNKEYIAEMARKYYFLSKPGEFIIITPEE